MRAEPLLHFPRDANIACLGRGEHPQSPDPNTGFPQKSQPSQSDIRSGEIRMGAFLSGAHDCHNIERKGSG